MSIEQLSEIVDYMNDNNNVTDVVIISHGDSNGIMSLSSDEYLFPFEYDGTNYIQCSDLSNRIIGSLHLIVCYSAKIYDAVLTNGLVANNVSLANAFLLKTGINQVYCLFYSNEYLRSTI